MKKTTLFISIITLVFSLSIKEGGAQDNQAGIICSPQTVNGKTVMRCLSGANPNYTRPGQPNINTNITPINPPSAPPITNRSNNNNNNTDNTPDEESYSSREKLHCEYPGQAPSPGTGPGPCGSLAVSANNCSTDLNPGHEIIQAWQYNLPYNYGATESMRFGMRPGQVMSFRFRIPEETAENNNWFPHKGTAFVHEHPSRGMPAPMYISVSERRCDFNHQSLYPNTPTYNPCHKNSGVMNSLDFVIRKNSDHSGNRYECTLRSGKTYYFNIRFENNANGYNSCDPTWGGNGITCGIISQLS